MSSRFSKQNTDGNGRQNEIKLDFEGAELDFHDKLKQSHNDLDQLINSGDYMLRNLKEQHYELKGVRGKILDVGQMVCMYLIFHIKRFTTVKIR